MEILIVDDNNSNLLLLEININMLSKKTIITKATNGKEALRLCEQRDFDLVIMDIEMPIMNGVEATIEIKKIKKIKIVAFTAYPKDEITNYDSAKFDDYFRKPICTEKLRKILNL